METKYTEIIDKYLGGELEGQGLKDFEEKFNTDPQLQLELKLEKELNAVIKDEDVIDFREQVIEVRTAIKDEKNNNVGSSKIISFKSIDRQWYLLAASVILLFGLAYYFVFLFDQTFSNEQLYSQYYEPYPSDVSVRTNDIGIEDPALLGFMEYEESNFEDAAKYFNLAIQQDDANSNIYFYLAISYLETNFLKDAVRNLKMVVDDKFNLFNEQAKWYLVLAYLKMDKAENEKTILSLLDEIIAKDGDRAKDAKDLLEKLKRQ